MRIKISYNYYYCIIEAELLYTLYMNNHMVIFLPYDCLCTKYIIIVLETKLLLVHNAKIVQINAITLKYYSIISYQVVCKLFYGKIITKIT